MASLGKFSEEDLAAGWEDLEALLDGRRFKPKEGDLFDARKPADQGLGWELADLKSLNTERLREFGFVFLALALWRRLGLHELLAELIEPGREEIAWADVAAVLTVGKFCGQASELGIAEEWYTNKKMLRNLPKNTTLIGRIRKDAKLNAKPENQPELGRRRLYGEPLPTPEQIRQDPTIPWAEVQARVNGKLRTFEIKTLDSVRWRAAGSMDLRLIIIRPVGFQPRKGARVSYTRPALASRSHANPKLLKM